MNKGNTEKASKNLWIKDTKINRIILCSKYKLNSSNSNRYKGIKETMHR